MEGEVEVWIGGRRDVEGMEGVRRGLEKGRVGRGGGKKVRNAGKRRGMKRGRMGMEEVKEVY